MSCSFVLLSVIIVSAMAMGPPPGDGGGGGGGGCVEIDTQSSETCANDGSSYTYTETLGSDLRTISTSHCPNHNWISLNPNYPYVNSGSSYAIPIRPNLMTSQKTSLVQQGGGVGVLLNGAMIYSPFAGGDSLASDYSNDYADSASALEGDTFDFSGQHAASTTQAYVL